MRKIEDINTTGLNWYEMLSPLTDLEFDSITELVALTCDVPVAIISIMGQNNKWYKSSFSTAINDTYGSHIFCKHTIQGNELFEIPDTIKDERFTLNSSAIRFYAGYPIKDAKGIVLGTLSVVAYEPKSLSVNQKKALKLFSGQVTDLIAARKQNQDFSHFEKLFRLSNDLIFIGGDNGFFKHINPAFSKILGWDKEYLLTTSTFDLIHPDDIDNTTRQLQSMTEGQDTINFLQRFKTKNGDYRTIQWASTPEPATGYIFGIGRDITEENSLEKSLAHTKEMLERTNKVARVGGWELDLQKQELFWSSVTKEIHEAEPDYVPDLTRGIDFYKEGPSRDKVVEVINLAVTKGLPWNEELQLITALGNEIWVRALGNVEFENGVCKRLYGTFQDIDKYKRAELALRQSMQTQEKLNAALIQQIELVETKEKTIRDIQEYKFLADSIPAIIWTSNADGSLDYYNRYWFDYTGLTLEETKTAGWGNIIHPEDEDTDRKNWQECLASGKPYQSESRFKRKADGAYRWHLSRALPMKNDQGEIIKWFGSCTDIDEYKRALDLENKISQFEDFNRIIAHNLRGPAGSIKMMLNMLGDAETKEESSELLAMLDSSSGALSETLEELMKVMEVRNNKDMAYDSCNLNDLVGSIKNMLKGQILAKKATIKTNFEVTEMLFPKLYLESVFYNMISNALKYSKTDVAPEILITSTLVNGQIVLSFKDNGLGIDLEKHGANMFKLNNVFHTGFDSKGVGLFMTKTQIETFGGKISVESKPDMGATFTVVF